MSLIDKFKNKDEQEKLREELKSKVGKEEKGVKKEAKAEIFKETGKKRVNQPEQTENLKREKASSKVEKENLQEEDSIEKEEVEKQDLDDLERFVDDFISTYADSKKTSRMIRLQDENYKLLVKLKVRNIKLSDFINFSIQFTTKSPEYARIIKLFKNPK